MSIPNLQAATDPLQATAEAWWTAGRRTVVVEVLTARGSVPRGAGTRMLVAADAVAGTIGGGHLELKAIERARLRLARPAWPAGDRAADADAIDDHYPLGPALGQCCGGAVTLRSRPLSPATLADWPPIGPRFMLQLHGAGHVGRAIVRLLRGLPCRVDWVDERDDAFPAEEPEAPHVQRLVSDDATAEVAAAAPGTHFLVMTHRHDLDLRLVDAVLRRGDAAGLGLIGSATKRARFEHRLRERGHGDAALAGMRCPVGLPGLDGKAPEVIAVSVVAQLLLDHPEAATAPVATVAGRATAR